MNELVTTFHIDIKMIIAQLVNFLIVFWVLKKFAYAPIIKIMNDRAEKIEKGIKNAEEAGNKLAKMEEKEKAVLLQARQEAQEIIKNAQKLAENGKIEILEIAQQEAAKILSDAKKKIEQEGEKVMSEIKKEIAQLILMATEKVIGEKMDIEQDKKMIERIVSEIK